MQTLRHGKATNGVDLAFHCPTLSQKGQLSKNKKRAGFGDANTIAAMVMQNPGFIPCYISGYHATDPERLDIFQGVLRSVVPSQDGYAIITFGLDTDTNLKPLSGMQGAHIIISDKMWVQQIRGLLRQNDQELFDW